MKNKFNKLILTLFGLFIFSISQGNGISAVDSTDWEKKIVEQGTNQLLALIRQNDQNQREGHSSKNKYIFWDTAPTPDVPPNPLDEALKANGTITSKYPQYNHSAIHMMLNDGDKSALNTKLAEYNGQLPTNTFIYVGLDAFLWEVVVQKKVKDRTAWTALVKSDIAIKADYDQAHDLFKSIYAQVVGKIRDLTGKRVLVISYGMFREVVQENLISGTVEPQGKQWMWANFRDSQENNQGLRDLIFNGYSPYPSEYSSLGILNAADGFAQRIKQAISNQIVLINCNDFVRSNSITKLRTILDAERIGEHLKQFNAECYRLLEFEDRIHALKKITTLDLTGGFLGNGLENVAVKLISTAPIAQIDPLLTSLKNDPLGNEKLISVLIRKLDDGISGNNYTAFIKAISTILLQSPSYLSVFTNVDETNYIAENSFTWDKSYFTSIVREPIGTQTYNIGIEANGQVKIIRTYVDTYNFTSVNRAGEPVYTPSWATENPIFYDPFAPVLFIDKSNLGLIDQNNVGFQGVGIVPAIFFKYAKDKEFNDDAVKSVSVAVDGVLMVTGAGEIAAALRTASYVIRTLRAAYVIADVANAGCNIALTVLDLGNDNDFTTLVNDYNSIMTTIGLSRLGAGAGRVTINRAFGAVNGATTLSRLSKSKVFSFLFKTYAKRGKLLILHGANNAAAKSIYKLQSMLEDELLRFFNVNPQQFKEAFNILNSKGINNVSDEFLEVLSASFEKGITLNTLFGKSFFTKEHFEEIEDRLIRYPELRRELVINPSQMDYVSEILRNPDKYKEIIANAQLPSSSPLYKWAYGRFRNYLFKLGDDLEEHVSGKITTIQQFHPYLNGIPPFNIVEKQIRLKPQLANGTYSSEYWIADDLILKEVGTSPNGKKIYEAVMNDTKLSSNAPWTPNQTKFVIEKFNSGTTELTFQCASLDKNVAEGCIIKIKKDNVFKTVSCGNRRVDCSSTSKVTDFSTNHSSY